MANIIPPHEKPDIKINCDFMESNLGWTPDPPTDDDIYYFWGKKLTTGICMKPLSKSKEAKEVLEKGADRQSVIEFAKKKCLPIMPDDQEFIPRKYWPNLNALVGENLGVLGHPIWEITSKIIRDTWKPTSTTLIIQACANNKPYIENMAFAHAKKRHQEGFCDVIVNSIEAVPLEYTYYYPFRHYDWAHINETEFMTDALARHEISGVIEFIRFFGYKKIIIYGTPFPDTAYKFMYDELCDQFRGTDVEILLVNDEEFSANILKYEANNNWGILKNRWFNYYASKRRIDDMIGYNGPNPSPTWEEIQEMRLKRIEDRKNKTKIKLSNGGFSFNKKSSEAVEEN